MYGRRREFGKIPQRPNLTELLCRHRIILYEVIAMSGLHESRDLTFGIGKQEIVETLDPFV